MTAVRRQNSIKHKTLISVYSADSTGSYNWRQQPRATLEHMRALQQCMQQTVVAITEILREEPILNASFPHEKCSGKSTH